MISADQKLHPNYAFSPDSRYVAESGTSRNSIVRVLELPTGKQVSAFGKHHVYGIAMGPDGSSLTSSYGDLVTLWNLSSGERWRVLRGFKGYVVGLSFSQDERDGLMSVVGRSLTIKKSPTWAAAPAPSAQIRYLITPSTAGLIPCRYDKGGTIRVFRVGRH